MADSITSLNAATGIDSAAIGATRAGQQVSKAVVAKLLASIEQAGQAQVPARSPDRVQISQQAQRMLAAEQSRAG